MNSEAISLAAFWEKCRQHDWTFEMSDDYSVTKRGRVKHAALHAQAKQSPEHQALFDGWRAHVWSGKPWGTEQAPAPERPPES